MLLQLGICAPLSQLRLRPLQLLPQPPGLPEPQATT